MAVVGEREIRDRGYRTLAELLADIPGFYVEPDERRDVVLTRGLPQSILILYDGVPLVFDAGRDDLPVGEELSLENVRRVEVLRGPGTALWGANAFTGIVNVVAEDGRDLDGARLRGEVGATETTVRGGAAAAVGSRGTDHEWSLAARASSESGPPRRYLGTPAEYLRIDPVAIPASAERVDGDGRPGPRRFVETTGKFRWKRFSVTGRWSDFDSRSGLSSYSHSLLEPDRNERRRVPVQSVRAAWTETRERGGASFGLFYLRSLHDDRYPLYARAPLHRFGGEIDVRALSENAGVDATLERTVGRHTLSGGLLFARNRNTLATDYVDPQTGTRSSNAFRRHFVNGVIQVHAEDRVVFAERWRLTVGASYDNQTEFEPSVNPRAGLVVRVRPGWIAKALYGEAIRTPDTYDLVGLSAGAAGDVSTVRGNPDLRPEKIRTAELGADYRRGSIATVSMALFGSRAEDLIEDSASGGEIRPVNRGSRYAAGIEALWSLAPTSRLSVHGAYTFARTAEEIPDLWDRPLPSAPQHVAVLGATVSPRRWLSLYAGNRAVSRRAARGEAHEGRLGAYVVTDANVRVSAPGWRFGYGLHVRNLFDTHYWHRNEAVPGRNVPVEIPGDRRRITVTVEGRF